MTKEREKQIRIAANLTFIGYDRVLGFEAGAKWADENPERKLGASPALGAPYGQSPQKIFSGEGSDQCGGSGELRHVMYVCSDHPIGAHCEKCEGVL